MRTDWLMAAAGAALLLAACDSRVEVKGDEDFSFVSLGDDDPLKSITRLECPDRENKLTRTEQAANGASCVYAGPDGTEVRLQLVALNGRPPAEVVGPYRAEAARLVPVAMPAPPEPPVAPLAPGAVPPPPPPPPPGASADSGERVQVRLPGVTVDADDDRAHVRVAGGITVEADDREGVARVRSDDGRLNVHADEKSDTAVVEVDQGEGGAVRTSYVLTSGKPGPQGWRLAAVEARGPRNGPIVVATLRSREGDGDDHLDAIKDLVRKNVGG